MLGVSLEAIETDQAWFLFDNGETKAVAAMLRYAAAHDAQRLADLDFRIVLSGAALDARGQEPFCHYSDRLIDFSTLGVEEQVDRFWKRDASLSSDSLQRICNAIHVRKKVFAGASCVALGQILKKYRMNHDHLRTIAYRDSISPEGITDYFPIAQQVCAQADGVFVSSEAVAQTIGLHAVVVGHPELEEWEAFRQSTLRHQVMRQMGLPQDDRPIVLYAGVYGDHYAEDFRLFLEVAQSAFFQRWNPQVLIAPHPRHCGAVEHTLCEELASAVSRDWLFSTQRAFSSKEALQVADVLITADPTSTMVFHAKAAGKHVVQMSPYESPISRKMEAQGIFSCVRQEVDAERALLSSPEERRSIFDLFGIPKGASERMWSALSEDHKSILASFRRL